ncbi:hypothetical protein DID88_008408 [Monilinia fructigena]|uniref:Uncharacterized protein n=1 Tax=Monilinia fructigena TaxID=38457 RepID=A0A395J7N5_9HELO|nr:hypothetical protein DID88_008408 [Monilinia fructigena]
MKSRLHFIDTTFLGDIVPNVRRIDLEGFRETILHPDIEGPDKMDFVLTADEMGFEWTSPAEVDHEPILPRFLKISPDPR